MPPNDPFGNPDNRVVDWTTRGTGQYNQKVVNGPDRGVHRGYVPGRGRTFQTGTDRRPRSPSPPDPSGR